MKIIETIEEAKECLASNDKALVSFMARWCPPCRMINLTFEAFEEENTDVKIYKIDVHQFKELSEEYQATSVPVTFIVENGHIVKSIKGFVEVEDLTKIYYDKE